MFHHVLKGLNLSGRKNVISCRVMSTTSVARHSSTNKKHHSPGSVIKTLILFFLNDLRKTAKNILNIYLCKS